MSTLKAIRGATCWACGLVAVSSAQAQELFSVDAGREGDPVIRFDARAMAELDSFVLENVPVGGSIETLDIRLGRFPVLSERTRVTLGTSTGGVELPFDPESVQFYRGDVPGLAGSHAFLAIGLNFSVGRVELGPGRGAYTISAPTGGIERTGEWVVTPTRAVPGLPATCGVVDVVGMANNRGELRTDRTMRRRLLEARAALGGRGLEAGKPEPVLGMRQVELGVISDYEVFLLFNNEFATAEYLALVYGAASDLTMRDVRARMDIVEMTVWIEPDPYGAGSPIPARLPGTDVTELFSGTRIQAPGGTAFICGTASELHGAVGFFGGTINPMVHSHDVRVAAHELGHNIGAPHTHDIGIDRCDLATREPRRGTLMSYCSQSYSGGDANTDLRFHTEIQEFIESCMPAHPSLLSLDCNQNGVDDTLDIASGTSADLNSSGVPDECEDCNGNKRLDNIDIALGASQDLNFNGVPDECEPDCNGNGVPDDLDVLSGFGDPVFFDLFGSNQGWVIENLGATDGDWEIAAPVADPSWPHAPFFDSDGNGFCMLTDNAAGESDVDGGATRATTPEIDLSANENWLLFDYFLTAPGSEDTLLLEGFDGTGWKVIRQIALRTNRQWLVEFVTPQDFAAAGMIPYDRSRLRFTIRDTGPDSILEGALDFFAIFPVLTALEEDLNGNGVPDSCEADCNTNGVADYNEIVADMSLDVDRNAVLDSCQNCDGDEFTDFEEIDGAGNVWAAVPDAGRIRQYHAITGVYVGESDAVLSDPSDVLITPDARVLVSSTGDDRVVEFDRRGNLVGDLISAGSGGLSEPGAMVLSPRGTLLVASTGSDEVLEYDLLSGNPLGAFVSGGSGGLIAPYGLTFQRDGNLFVTSVGLGVAQAEIIEYDRDTGAFVRVFVSAANNDNLNEPHDIAFMPSGARLLATTASQRLLSYDAETGEPLGPFNNGTFGGRLNDPWGLVIGPSGRLYVSMSGRGNDSHLTDPRMMLYDGLTGDLLSTYVHGRDSRLDHPRGFDFLPTVGDCNLNMLPDECDISSGYSMDLNGNGVPDECETCYADCDQSTGAEVLDVFDFLCFQDAFLTNDPWACGCDTMSGAGVCDVFDYLCFVDGFMNGCP